VKPTFLFSASPLMGKDGVKVNKKAGFLFRKGRKGKQEVRLNISQHGYPEPPKRKISKCGFKERADYFISRD
jgi:hypothetical protein